MSHLFTALGPDGLLGLLGAGWGGKTFAKYPASSRASSQPILKQTRSRRPRMVQLQVKVTQLGGGRGDIETQGFLTSWVPEVPAEGVTSVPVCLWALSGSLDCTQFYCGQTDRKTGSVAALCVS